jgi:Na+/proline symporter
MTNQVIASTVFSIVLIATFLAAWFGKIHSRKLASSALPNQRLSKWLVGLSAGATANSGFVVSGAVGLGFSFGAQWLMLPVAWLIGDIVFWTLFPHRINARGREVSAVTMTDVLVGDLPRRSALTIKVIVGTIVLICLGGYVAAQFLAGEKFMSGAFALDGSVALLVFAILIIGYTSLGDFRGSIYADSLQALIRVIGTAVALAIIIHAVLSDPSGSNANWAAAGPSFFDPFPQATIWGSLGFVAGFAAAALGFGLGQPQIVTRYLAGASPSETRAAWWIYLAFVHGTWISMTAFGMLLRGVMPEISDPEAGFGIFFRSQTGPVLTGLISADIFATIAATTNSLLVVMAQTFRFDLIGRQEQAGRTRLWPFTLMIGLITMLLSLTLDSSVFSLAIASVSLLGAAIAPTMAVRLFGYKLAGTTMAVSIVAGFGAALAWKFFGYDAVLNEALPGMIAGLGVLAVGMLLNRLVRAPQVFSDAR